MAAAASTSVDPSQFAVSVAFGYGHVLDKVLSFVEQTSSELSPVLAVSLALPVLLAYLVVVTLAFAVRVAADSYAHVVLAHGTSASAALVRQALVAKIAVYLIILCCFTVVALLRFSSLSTYSLSLGPTEL